MANDAKPVNDEPVNESIGDRFDRAVNQVFNVPQSMSERAGYGPGLKVPNGSPNQCKCCRGTGRVITAMSCMPPHIYGDCPVCSGTGKKVESIDSPSIKVTKEMADTVVKSISGLFNNPDHQNRTIAELYEHRIELYLKLAELIYWNTRDNTVHRDTVWCSKVHSDGSSINGWFVLGINQKPGEQITYHLPIKYWDRACQHVVKVLDKAPEFDGHTAKDVLERLRWL